MRFCFTIPQKLSFHEFYTLCVAGNTNLLLLKQWDPSRFRIRIHITHATYSCDSESIYVGLDDGSVAVLTSSSLSLRCLIKLNSYLSANPKSVWPVPFFNVCDFIVLSWLTNSGFFIWSFAAEPTQLWLLLIRLNPVSSLWGWVMVESWLSNRSHLKANGAPLPQFKWLEALISSSTATNWSLGQCHIG